MPSDLTVNVRQAQDAFAVIAVGGAIDYDSAGALHDQLVALVDEGRRHLVLDMSQVGFCDSSGLNTLIQVLRRARARQGSLALVAPTEPVQRVLRISEVDTVITHYPSVAEALRPLTP
jgi:anti-sigma B factor antagonist